MNQFNPDSLFVRPSIYADRLQRGPGQYESRPSHNAENADAMAMMQSQQSANASQLMQQLAPLQQSLIGANSEGTPFPLNENERAATVQAMLDIIARPAWPAEERMAAMEWMQQMGLMPQPSLENQLFMPPGMR